jgi:hypothetical protein
MKEFFPKLFPVLACALKKIHQPCPRQKEFKEYQSEGAPNY